MASQDDAVSQVMIHRRLFIQRAASTAAGWWLLSQGLPAMAFAPQIQSDLAKWRKNLHIACGDLRQRKLTQEQWQDAVANLYHQVPLKDLLNFLDVERLTRNLTYPANMAAIVNVPLPAVEGIPRRVPYGHKIFALAKGRAIIPHAHNDMVSAHLVIKGRFRVRTFNRRFDLEQGDGTVHLEPVTDRTFGPGDLLTMSDSQENIHWLVALTEQAWTFDIPVTDLHSGRAYPTPANKYSMIHLDPLAYPPVNGVISAPVVSFEDCLAKYGGTGV